MGDDAWALHARVFGLNMKHPPAVTNVVIEAEYWGRLLGHAEVLQTQKVTTPARGRAKPSGDWCAAHLKTAARHHRTHAELPANRGSGGPPDESAHAIRNAINELLRRTRADRPPGALARLSGRTRPGGACLRAARPRGSRE